MAVTTERGGAGRRYPQKSVDYPQVVGLPSHSRPGVRSRPWSASRSS